MTLKIWYANKGDWYESVEINMRAVLNGDIGDKFLDADNCFKEDIEIHFIQKRSPKKSG